MKDYKCIGSYCVYSNHVSLWENKNSKSRWGVKVDDTVNKCYVMEYFTDENDALLYYNKEIKQSKNK